MTAEFDRRVARALGDWARDGGRIDETVFATFAVREWPAVTLVALAIVQHEGRKREEQLLRASIRGMCKPQSEDVTKPKIAVVSYVAEEVSHRVQCGRDYGCHGRVLFRVGLVTLVWRPGGSGWAGRGQRAYYHAHLQVINPELADASTNVINDSLTKGPRLSKGLLVQHRERIAKLMGISNFPACSWEPKFTAIIHPERS